MQDWALCQEKFPDAICRPISAQFMADEVIALFEFEQTEQGLTLASEKHYRLVNANEISTEELRAYMDHSPNG